MAGGQKCMDVSFNQCIICMNIALFRHINTFYVLKAIKDINTWSDNFGTM